METDATTLCTFESETNLNERNSQAQTTKKYVDSSKKQSFSVKHENTEQNYSWLKNASNKTLDCRQKAWFQMTEMNSNSFNSKFWFKTPSASQFSLILSRFSRNNQLMPEFCICENKRLIKINEYKFADLESVESICVTAAMHQQANEASFKTYYTETAYYKRLNQNVSNLKQIRDLIEDGATCEEKQTDITRSSSYLPDLLLYFVSASDSNEFMWQASNFDQITSSKNLIDFRIQAIFNKSKLVSVEHNLFDKKKLTDDQNITNKMQMEVFSVCNLKPGESKSSFKQTS